MPPAFNLSQDQTLQFNLCKLLLNGIEVNFHEFRLSVSIWSKDLVSVTGLLPPKHPRLSAVNFKELDLFAVLFRLRDQRRMQLWQPPDRCVRLLLFEK